jgi:hypothetical protein
MRGAKPCCAGVSKQAGQSSVLGNIRAPPVPVPVAAARAGYRILVGKDGSEGQKEKEDKGGA